MKYLKNLLSRFKQSHPPRQGKKGSSLGMVMMVGAALVIWVMCIIPLMTTAGSATYEIQGDLSNYLGNRSAIEYCKSELVHMAKTEIPSTFAVMEDNNGKYFVKHKKSNGMTIDDDDGYKLYVDTLDTDDDRLDEPKKDASGNVTAEGKQVTSICAVRFNSQTYKYDIVISTYDEGEPGMRYTATFTPSGTLKIRPEAYNSGDALPLSDFVLVDGKLGGKTVWNSTITRATAEDLEFREVLLTTYNIENTWDYANAGKYPCLFKTTAHTASSLSSEIGDELDLGYLSSSERWIIPTAVASNASKSAGNIWYTLSGNNIQIKMQGNSEVDITDRCVIYVNGTPSSSLPSKTGSYTIAVDFTGTDYTDDSGAKFDETQVNVLPICGLTLGTKTVSGHGENELDDEKTYTVKKVEEVPVLDPNNDNKPVLDENGQPDKTYTVTLGHGEADTNNDGVKEILFEDDLMYGVICGSDPDAIEWQRGNNVFQGLDKDEAYFFYVCRPASYNASTGKYMTASEIQTAWMVFPVKYVESLTNNGKYAISGSSGDVMYKSGSNLVSASIYSNIGGEFGYVGVPYDLSAFTWTAEKSDGKWSFKYANTNQKLTANGTLQVSDSDYATKQSTHQHGFLNYSTCTEYTGVNTCSVSNLNLTLGSGTQFTVSDVDKYDFQIKNTLSATFTHRKYGCGKDYWGNNGTLSFNVSKDYFLSLVSPSASLKEGSTNIRFIEIPEVPDLGEIDPPNAHQLMDSSVTYSPEGVSIGFTGNPNVSAVYANGEQIQAQNGKYMLNAGTYDIVIKATNGGIVYYSHPGVLTVKKAVLEGDLSVTTAAVPEDELAIKVTASGLHAENAGYIWYICKDSGNTYPFEYDDTSYTFRMEYGSYNFSVKETGSVNYEGKTSPEVSGTVNAAEVILTDDDRVHFMFTVNEDGSSGPDSLTWYKLPQNLNHKRIKAVQYVYNATLIDGKDFDRENFLGIYNSLKTITSDTYAGENFDEQSPIFKRTITYELSKIEIKVTNSKYNNTVEPWYEITNRLYVFDINNHQDSVVKAESLYFMDGDYSINTHGNKVDLHADLVVLNNDITYGGYNVNGTPTYGSVVLHPYTQTHQKVLLFTVNTVPNMYGHPLFEAKTFYEIPAGTDIYSLTTDDFAELGITSCPIEPTNAEQREHLQYILRSGTYPVISLDIAYASEEQLGRIISSETMGWTVNGILSGQASNVINNEYCIPTYVTSISGNVNYKANRVLFVAGGTNNSLVVPSNVRFTTRYFSLDAVELSNSGGSFTLKNLGQDNGLIQIISDLIRLTKSYTKTFQMDFEQDTRLRNGESVVTMATQICRFPDGKDQNGNTIDGVNLFASNLPSLREPLTAKYTPSELEALFARESWWDLGLFRTVKVVDRYIELAAENEGETTVSLGARLKGALNIYTNYFYLDPDITVIDLSAGSNDITFNSHESGYTEKEYLGIFKGHSGDSYTGTILYFENDVTVKYRNNRTVEIAAGFYYIDATNNGVALSDFNQKATSIDLDELKDLAVYIDPDTGRINNSYVDTGLDDNESIGVGGFSGGNVG